MNRFGLSELSLKLIQNVLSRYHSVEIARIFGSRTSNEHDESSDIDLVLYGNFDYYTLGKIKLDLEEIDIPYFFDVLDFKNIHSDELKKQIEMYGKVIHKKSKGNLSHLIEK